MRQAIQTLLVLIVSEDTEQIKEEVDEVEVEAQRTKQSEFLHMLACIGCLHTHLLDLLCVVSGESDEDEHTYVAQDIVEACAAHEHVDNSSDDKTYQSHEQQLAERRKVGLRCVAHECHNAKCTGGDEECLYDCRHTVS